jgi:L-lactate dehydrogenase
MKIGVVGCGMVGSTAAFALVMTGIGREIILVDVNRARAEAEANDICHAVPFAHPMQVRCGDFADLADCKIVVIAAGVPQKPGETRMALLQRNAAVFAEVVPSIVKYASAAVLVVVSNPVDIMTHLAAHFAASAAVPSSRVIGSGTMLDTARFRSLLGRRFAVDPQYVHAYVIGEHGDSEVLTWSLVSIAGTNLKDFAILRGENPLTEKDRQLIDEKVRRAAYNIIAGKAATYYGIASAIARLVNVLLHDQRAVLTICKRVEVVQGCEGVTLGLPHIVGAQGAISTIPLKLDPDEEKAFQRSASILYDVIESLKL